MSRLKIVKTRDFVGHVMPIDTQCVAVKNNSIANAWFCVPADSCASVAKRVRNALTPAWPICAGWRLPPSRMKRRIQFG